MSSSNPAMVTVRNLSKKYCTHLRTSLWYGLRDIAAEAWPSARIQPSRLRRAEFWSLEDVSFELYRGEALAIIGDNGAGKSTLLKLLNGLLKPDAGLVQMLGRVGALIELGAGLDPVLTGRENIFVRAALLGVSRAQVLPLLPAIISFTGLGTAIEMPVQFYSSGMVSRLAYAVAAHLHPDVLLVDEVLAVGDFDFQRKCLAHMRSYLASGGSLILVSHQPHHIQAVCQRGLVLEKGRLAFTGSATQALDYYFARQAEAVPAAATTANQATTQQTPAVVIEQVQVTGASPVIRSGEEVTLTLTYQAAQPMTDVSWGFYFYTSTGNTCITGAHQPHAPGLQAGRHHLVCSLPRLPLTAGDYLVKAVIGETKVLQPLALWGWENSPTRLKVEEEASQDKNVQKMLQQLVTIDVRWN